MSRSLSEALTRQLRRRPVAPEDLERASLYLLDALASAWAGGRTAVGQRLARWAGADASNTAREAFLLGALTHITETDDLHRASVTHPGCVVVPCVLALGRRHRIGHDRLLRAMLVGFEAMCRIGTAVGPSHYRYWHNTATCGPFGSAMAAADLLGLDEACTVHALGNAGTQAAGLWEFLETGAMSKHLHAGRASEAGVLAAELAAVGFTGAPRILEGRAGLFAAMCPDGTPERVLAEPEAPWQLHLTSIKPWPCCRHTHPAIDAATELHGAIEGRMPERVSVETYAAALDLCDRAEPDNDVQARFSLQHCVATALARGGVTLDDFDRAARDRVIETRRRVVARRDERFDARYPDAWGARVTLVMADGSTLRAERPSCLGDPERALDADAMQVKARALLVHGGLDGRAADALCERVLSMPGSRATDDLVAPLLDALGDARARGGADGTGA